MWLIYTRLKGLDEIYNFLNWTNPKFRRQDQKNRQKQKTENLRRDFGSKDGRFWGSWMATGISQSDLSDARRR